MSKGIYMPACLGMNGLKGLYQAIGVDVTRLIASFTVHQEDRDEAVGVILIWACLRAYIGWVGSNEALALVGYGPVAGDIFRVYLPTWVVYFSR